MDTHAQDSQYCGQLGHTLKTRQVAAFAPSPLPLLGSVKKLWLHSDWRQGTVRQQEAPPRDDSKKRGL